LRHGRHGKWFSEFADQFKGKDFTGAMKVGNYLNDLKASENYDKIAGQTVAVWCVVCHGCSMNISVPMIGTID
jgi:hypothetical protein